jgi:hypothetical protein
LQDLPVFFVESGDSALNSDGIDFQKGGEEHAGGKVRTGT